MTWNETAAQFETPTVCASDKTGKDSCAVLSKKTTPSRDVVGVGDCVFEPVGEGDVDCVGVTLAVIETVADIDCV